MCHAEAGKCNIDSLFVVNQASGRSSCFCRFQLRIGGWNDYQGDARATCKIDNPPQEGCRVLLLKISASQHYDSIPRILDWRFRGMVARRLPENREICGEKTDNN